MLSTAAVALLAGHAFADTTIDKSTSTALTTGTLESYTSTTGSTTTTTDSGTANAGNITIQSGGTVSVGLTQQGAITVNTNNFVSNSGVIENKGQSDASGIRVDMTVNPDPIISTNTANAANATLLGIYNAGTIDLTGSGTAKHGIWLNGTTGTFTGPITLASSSAITMEGDSSQAITMDTGTVLQGDMTVGGTISLTQTTATSTTSTALYGLYDYGQINGNFVQSAGSTITVTGAGSTGLLFAGNGINGNIVLGGSVIANGTTTATQLTNTSSNTTHPEGGSALEIAASVTNGISIQGPGFSGDTSATAATITTQGLSPAVQINPGLNSVTQSAPMVIGVYTTDGTTAGDTNDPGFSFYNRGTISASPVDANNSIVGMSLTGNSAYSTTLTGGLFNSGTLSASSTTSGTTAAASTVTGLLIGNYTSLGVAPSGFTKKGASGLNPGDQAAFVNSSSSGSGTISASTTGTRGGTATAIEIAQYASVPSLINTGSISASVTATDLTLDGLSSSHPVAAYGIIDFSGTLTSIINTGSITTSATTLNNDLQQTIAIDLSSGTQAANGAVTIVDQATGASSATITGAINFGTSDNETLSLYGNDPSHLASVTGNVTYGLTPANGVGGDKLTIGSYGILTGSVIAPDGVSVDVQDHGALVLQNTTTALVADDFHVESGGLFTLTVSEAEAITGMVQAKNSATIDSNANLGIAFGSFVPQGSDQFVLITAPSGKLSVHDIATYATSISTPIANGGTMPFLFESASLQCIGTGPGCSGGSSSSLDKLVLNVVPKTKDQLGLIPGSYGYQVFDYANTALGVDDTLGSAMVNGVRNTTQAQAAYNSFTPNVTGGSRAIVISITDQATGPVAARQRMLNMYAKDEGEETLWGQQFVQMIKDPGQGAVQADGTRLESGFKDHGFGFAMGMDSGSPKTGWYGGAFTFYAGDVGELARDSHQNEQWYILSGYSAWRGKGLFFDSKIDVGYGHIDGKRYINLDIPSTTTAGSYSTYTREADNKHAGTLISGGFTTGAMLAYGATTFMPQFSMDGLLMREEGYTETNPGTTANCANSTAVCDGFDLQVQPYYAKSLRAFVGAALRHDLDLGDFYLQPELRAGYRYDFFNDPVKLKAAFAYADTTGAKPAAGSQFEVTGPDPAQGNFVLGGSLAATTDTWTFGLSYDFIRGTNGAFDQVGMINLLGRI